MNGKFAALFLLTLFLATEAVVYHFRGAVAAILAGAMLGPYLAYEFWQRPR